MSFGEFKINPHDLKFLVQDRTGGAGYKNLWMVGLRHEARATGVDERGDWQATVFPTSQTAKESGDDQTKKTRVRRLEAKRQGKQLDRLQAYKG